MKTLLQPADVASELQVQTDDVFRLISKNRLTASQVPQNRNDSRRKPPEYRIRKAAFETFAETGLEDLTIDRDRNKTWLTRQPDLEIKVRASFAEAALSSITDDQVLADVRRQAARLTGHLQSITDTYFEFKTAPPEFAAEMRRSAFVRNVQNSYFGLSLREAYIRSRARKEALRIVSKTGVSFNVSNLVKLYESPKALTNITAATVAKLATQSLRGSSSRLIKYADENTRQTYGGTEMLQMLSVNVRINVSLPLTAIFTDREFLTFSQNAF